MLRDKRCEEEYVGSGNRTYVFEGVQYSYSDVMKVTLKCKGEPESARENTLEINVAHLPTLVKLLKQYYPDPRQHTEISNRFAVFIYKDGEARGGMLDCRGTVDQLEWAHEMIAEEEEADHAHVIDLETGVRQNFLRDKKLGWLPYGTPLVKGSLDF